MRRVALGSHALRVDDAGGSGPALLCLHGLVDTLEVWDRVLPALRARGRPVRFDQRGHGESGAPPGPCTRDDLAGDALAVLDALGIGRAVLVGHSMGGVVAMAAALRAPRRVAGLVLVGTASRCNERTAQWYERIACAGESDGLAGLARAIYGPGSRRALRGDARAIASVTRMLKSLHEDPLTPRLAELACPALLLVGESDPMGSRASERIAEAIGPERARLVVAPGCGHWVHVEAPETFAKSVIGWLEELCLEEVS